MFNNYYGSGYSAMPATQMAQTWQPRIPQIQPQAPAYMGEIVKVNGQAGAQALRLTPNSSLLALDATAPLVWVCQADGAGYFTPEPFSITPYQAEPQKNPLEERIKALEERMEAIMSEQPDPVQVGAKRRRNAETGE